MAVSHEAPSTPGVECAGTGAGVGRSVVRGGRLPSVVRQPRTLTIPRSRPYEGVTLVKGQGTSCGRFTAVKSSTASGSRRLGERGWRGMTALEEIDYSARRELDRAQMRQFITCRWVQEHDNVLISGATGTGKTSDSRPPVAPHLVASCSTTVLLSGDGRPPRVPGEPCCAHALLSPQRSTPPRLRCGVAFRILNGAGAHDESVCAGNSRKTLQRRLDRRHRDARVPLVPEMVMDRSITAKRSRPSPSRSVRDVSPGGGRERRFTRLFRRA